VIKTPFGEPVLAASVDNIPTFGLWYDFRQRPPLGDYARFYAECLEEIEEGERLGFTGVWLSEHHFVDDGYLPAPLVVAAAIAARTTSMTIGTNVLLLPMHHPLRVAEDAAAVALLSDGRFVLGVGQGYVQHEFEAFGFDRKKRPSLFEEGIEVIRQAVAEGRTGYEGRRWRFEDLPFEPRPSGGLPIFVGAFADPAIDRAARLADGFLASAGGGAFGETYRKVRAALERHGRADGTFPYVASGVAFVHEDAGRAREIVAPAIAYQRTRYAEWGTDRGEPKPAPIRPEDLPWERYLVGTPEEVAEGLIGLHQEAPYDHFCFWGRLPGLSHEAALENARLFAREVVPRVRRALGAKGA
jgi:alkanesulfonate monooxygenase SsuD/methylene tetrahydromethanopterin reductase-like flavin-dependent oxidoreductase (luciferase family)